MTVAEVEVPQDRIRARRAAGSFRQTLRTGRGRVGLALILVVVGVAVVGPFVTPSPPDTTLGPFFTPPSSHFWLGTDVLGRSVLSRVLDGGWLLLVMALAATVLGVGLGTIIGLTAAYFRGLLDTVRSGRPAFTGLLAWDDMTDLDADERVD